MVPRMRGAYSGGMLVEPQRLRFDGTQHYPAGRVVINFASNLQNEKGLLDKMPPKSQGYVYSLKGGILWCLQTFSNVALVALRAV